jgi:DNA-binding NarL/FixJ family response regulator
MTQQLFVDSNLVKQLTPRESVVLSAAKNNESVKTIAASLDIPKSIVLRHLSNIISKINDSDQLLAHQLIFSYNIDTRRH